MILWKSNKPIQTEALSGFSDRLSNIHVTKYHRIVAPVTDISSFGLHIFLWTALKLRPTEENPELMGTDWLYQHVSNTKVPFIKECIMDTMRSIKDSAEIKTAGSERYVLVSPKDIIFVTHEYEVMLSNLLHGKTKPENVRLPSRPELFRYPIAPYLQRLESLLIFTTLCELSDSGFSTLTSNAFDSEIENEVYGYNNDNESESEDN